MPFTSETAKQYGGAKPGAGRKPNKERQIKQQAADIARAFIEENVKPVLDNYLKLAKGYYETRYTALGTEYDVFVPDGATTRHFVNKILPDEQSQAQISPTIQFVQFNISNNDPPQLHAQTVPITILASDEQRDEKSVPGVASQEREGQELVKFRNF